MKTAFLINSKILNLHKIKAEIKSTFSQENYEFFESEYIAHLAKLTHLALSQNFANIVAVGGDGSLNEVVNGVITFFKKDNDYDWNQISKIKIGVLPCGSGNDFVKNFDVAMRIKFIKSKILENNLQLIDIGKTHFFNKKNQLEERFFLNITDLGMGAETMICKEKIPIWLGANFRYFYSITKTLLFYRKKYLEAKSQDFQWSGKVLNFVIANGKYFGNGLGIAPDAKIDDGIFNITVVGNISLLDYALHIQKVKKSKKINHPKVHYFATSKLEIRSKNSEKIAIDMDGEVVGFLPMKIENLKQKIQFIS